ncbi:MAG: restriction endonuclease subunit S [Myxococcota bacterium]
MSEDGLPSGWRWQKLTDITKHKSGNSKLIKGKLHPEPADGRYPGFSASGQDVWLDHFEHEGPAIIASAVGARCGRCFRADGKWSAVANTHIIWTGPEIDRDFLWRRINDQSFWIRGGSAQPFIKVKPSFERPFALPPIEQQQRIVEKVDALFAHSRKAKESLDRVPALLEKLKKSILAAAFRGDLTKDWREANPNVEPDWHRGLLEEERARIPKKSKHGRLWGAGASQSTPEVELPPSWNWVQVKDLGFDPGDVVQIGPMSMKSSEFEDSGVQVLNVGCVQWGYLELSKSNYLPFKRAEDFGRYRLQTNDVLFTRSGTVGRSALVTAEADGSLMTFHLLRVRVSPRLCLPRFLYLAFRGVPSIRKAIERSSMGSTRAGFNTRLLQELYVPLPPPEEQLEVISRADEMLRRCTEVDSQRERASALQRQLERSVLQQAFRGHLTDRRDAGEAP